MENIFESLTNKLKNVVCASVLLPKVIGVWVRVLYYVIFRVCLLYSLMLNSDTLVSAILQ